MIFKRFSAVAQVNSARAAIELGVNNKVVVSTEVSSKRMRLWGVLQEGLNNITLPSLNHAAVTRDYLPALAARASPDAGVSDACREGLVGVDTLCIHVH
jgi:hypothetical protein